MRRSCKGYVAIRRTNVCCGGWILTTRGARRSSSSPIVAPSWEHLIEQAGWPSGDDAQALIRGYEPLLAQISRGREFAFRVRANPVSSTRNPCKPSAAQKEKLAGSPRPRGVRVPHRTVKHKLAWFLNRTQRWGFQIPAGSAGEPDVLITGRKRLDFTKRAADSRGRRVVIETATFEGRLRVDDPDLFRKSLLTGIGSARAYGCGLITLAPLPPGR